MLVDLQYEDSDSEMEDEDEEVRILWIIKIFNIAQN